MDINRIPNSKKLTLPLILFIIALVAILFQIGHFVEHLIQVIAWIFGERLAPYMTSVGMWIMDWLGSTLFPTESQVRQAGLGFESLHLLGNLIYIVGTLGLWYFVRCKAMIWTNVIQIFHVLEHISLTVSFYYLNKAIGLSTLYGMPLEHMTLVAYRVWWHFFANAIPTAIVLFVLYKIYKQKKKSLN